MSIQLTKIQELEILHRSEEERNNVSFKPCHLLERLLWKKKGNTQLICIPRSSWLTWDEEGLGAVINNKPT